MASRTFQFVLGKKLRKRKNVQENVCFVALCITSGMDMTQYEQEAPF
jgi:hypothetical protein